MTDQTPQGGLYGPHSAPDDSRAAEGATEAGDGRVAARYCGDWSQQPDGSWALPVDGGILQAPANTSAEERARLADAWTDYSEPAPDTGLREQYVMAISRVLLDSAGRIVPKHIAETAKAVADSADAVLAVRDREMERLRAQQAEHLARLADAEQRAQDAERRHLEALAERGHAEEGDPEQERLRAQEAERKVERIAALTDAWGGGPFARAIRAILTGRQQEDERATQWAPGPVALARAAEQAYQQDNRPTH